MATQALTNPNGDVVNMDAVSSHVFLFDFITCYAILLNVTLWRGYFCIFLNSECIVSHDLFGTLAWSLCWWCWIIDWLRLAGGLVSLGSNDYNKSEVTRLAKHLARETLLSPADNEDKVFFCWVSKQSKFIAMSWFHAMARVRSVWGNAIVFETIAAAPAFFYLQQNAIACAHFCGFTAHHRSI